jgi:hypothetical protein
MAAAIDHSRKRFHQKTGPKARFCEAQSVASSLIVVAGHGGLLWVIDEIIHLTAIHYMSCS